MPICDSHVIVITVPQTSFQTLIYTQMAKQPRTTLAALDIGTSKIVCLIANIDTKGTLQVVGIGHQESKGIKAGVITNVTDAENAIRNAVSAAEQMAGVNVDRVIVNISGAKQKSHFLHVAIPINPNQEINTRDIDRLIDEGCHHIATDDREIIHCIALDYTLNDNQGIDDPKGMFGAKLGANLHIVSGCATTIINLTNCLARCHLDVESYVCSAYASGWSILTEDEKNLGVILIDFGSSNTAVASFKGGHFAYTHTIGMGGMHITNDIALGLSTQIESAERIKTLYGSLFTSSGDGKDIIDVPHVGEHGTTDTGHIQRSELVDIIKPRIEEIIEMLQKQTQNANLSSMGASIVICGGSSQLTGMKEYLSHHFDKPVRIGTPTMLAGLAESTKGPSFATSIGMLEYGLDHYLKHQVGLGNHRFNVNQTMLSLARWFKENF